MLLTAIATAAAAAAFSIATPPPATVTFTVVNEARVQAVELARVERAVEVQGRRMSREWGTAPIRFGRGGWPLELVRKLACAPACGGYHGTVGNGLVPEGIVAPAGTPWAVVNVSLRPWSYSFSHEVLEVTADPRGGRPEVCDPVDRGRVVRGVWVADWVGPLYFIEHPGAS